MVETYLNNAASLINKLVVVPCGGSTVSSKRNVNKFDYFIKMAYYLISIGIRVNSGDTWQWYDELFQNCENMIREYGGIKKLLHDFEYCHDCRFLLAIFQFRDIMSSESLKRGTICTINNYQSCLVDDGDAEKYPLDPYQGCCQLINLLLGEIMNTYVEVKRERADMLTQLENNIDVTKSRLDHFAKVNESLTQLSFKIDNCQPYGRVYELDKHDQCLQLDLFELNKITSKMYLFLYIKQTQPTSIEIQSLLLQALQLIQGLIAKDMVNGLNMALLICGITSCNKFDRNNIRRQFEQVYTKFPVGNVKRIWDIVEESWIRNSRGKLCIDWLDICHDFGWKISMG